MEAPRAGFFLCTYKVKNQSLLFSKKTAWYCTRQEISHPHITPQYKDRKIKGDYKGTVAGVCRAGCRGKHSRHTPQQSRHTRQRTGQTQPPTHHAHTPQQGHTQAHRQGIPHKEEQKSTQEYIEV